METDVGGWTVFQRRQDSKIDFYRGWEEYVNGFGNLKTEFWLGNDKLYKLTSRGQYELRINLANFNGDKAYAKYSYFFIGDRSTYYRLTVNDYSGTTEYNVRDYSDLDREHSRNGVYTIYPAGGAGFKAFCDMETDEGGWTVFQRRQDGKVDVYRGWGENANGFGNDKLYKLTSRGQYELRVNLEDFNGDKAYAKYSSFYIGDRSTNYRLTVNGYSGTAGDSLKCHDKQAFSIKDKDNDSHSSADCAERYKGVSWYKT
ncbi:Tenascin,Fibrinogen-like protein A,Ryncolin-2,Ryncolin-4,Tenascin-X,Fibrinogen C domain-containing protein 1-A,Ficolin-1-B,Ficolin-1-A,Ficolin-2,Ryncolin-1,Tenascin-R,Ficolin-3,Ryncolin-3,Ficolin-1,Fibrinogen C domain-containing protein 1-B,Fibrinogen C domain-containing protein 1 [Mytilus coruscus]|uniref:Fibrinogen C-terminal domain-containing protein n=1 Tax=Mytilus coruscus TaxID=42192 RepID=A0A6J8CUY4_MYTCO|nr:Tenascin,Fibrinogen-like protein A,Ryncolin-2,Ryncolin-4,Tenascin-X,Fibrinogen C domain-containing protein 1-A,Ficolin-1-B,Ficolin-1-A,Ficolin-2,Ryncolin-1,Tenascin-R,Ficolin-3,Ryncolin-3,Ficolin-1,Fibrinogen C domain-containing protein 1-B,Fibrinogen C domain-containing protein 1 [Mytilus coruscus]